MRFNLKEIIVIATQPSNKFDKEGVLFVKEKHDSLFQRKDIFLQKWCRLRGNLLFFCKTKYQYSEPTTLFVLEECHIRLEESLEVPYSFSLVFQHDEAVQQLGVATKEERDSWIQILYRASYDYMRMQLSSLKIKLRKIKHESENRLASEKSVRPRSVTNNSNHNLQQYEPFIELNLCCDNLICDGGAQPPSTFISVFINTLPSTQWAKLAQTEIVEKSSNPDFFTTLTFVKCKVTELTRIKLCVYSVKERLTCTCTLLGESMFTLDTLLQNPHQTLRLILVSPYCANVGFISISAREMTSTKQINTLFLLAEEEPLWSKKERPRSYSLPSKLSSEIGIPVLGLLKTLSNNFVSQTYRFHTGYGAELRVHEIMSESKLSFTVPLMLLNFWINEEKKLMEMILSIGELSFDWKQKYLAASNNHLRLINHYTELVDFLAKQKSSFKPSNKKADINFEFVPVNLHVQRMWAQNMTTCKTGVYDVVTVGAFCAFSRRFHEGGLLRLLNQLKSYCPLVSYDNNCAFLGPDMISKSAEAVLRIEQLQDQIESDFHKLIAVCDRGSRSNLQTILNTISNKGDQLRKVCVPHVVEEALSVWDSIKNGSISDISKETVKPQNPDQSFEKTVKISNSEESNSTYTSAFHDNKINECISFGWEAIEPLDLTHLNIKASILCMSGKIQSFLSENNCPLEDKFIGEHSSWTNELMPSIKKLRQSMHCLLKTAKLTYGIVSVKESTRCLPLTQKIRHRRDIVFSQALTSVITGLMTRLWCRNPDPIFIHMLYNVGVLCHFEGLLSCYGEEIGILEDMIVGINDLHSVLFRLEPFTSTDNPQPRIEGNRLFMYVYIPAPKVVMNLLPTDGSNGCQFSVICVFFNVGINEKASLAEKFGDTSLQDKINRDSFSLLREYVSRVQRASKMHCFSFSENFVNDLLDRLQIQTYSKKSKNVEILHLSSEICKQLGGIRFTSCKSAKDRTSMSVTLEQAMVLIKDFNLNEKELHRVLDCMRCEGTRRENTVKNTGVRKYHFNSLQLMTIPKLYRAPPGTFGNVEA